MRFDLNTPEKPGEMMKRILKVVLGLFVVLVAVLLANTLMFSSKQKNIVGVELVTLDSEALTARLSQAIQIKTISHQELSVIYPDQAQPSGR